MVGILETNLAKANEELFNRRLNLGWSYVANSTSTEKGRIWVSWDASILVVTPLIIHIQFIHSLVRILDGTSLFYATFVYAHNDGASRSILWEELLRLRANIQLLWVILGDFNCIAMHSDKVSFNRQQHMIDVELCSFIKEEGLSDHDYSGVHYTWNNNQE